VTQATLTLMRHAKSSWQDSAQSDHERPLNPRGRHDAPLMAQRLVERDSIPQLILCSSATRTRETAALLLSAFADASVQIRYEAGLYLASPESMLDMLTSVDDSLKHIMLLAHNPGIEELSASIAGYDTGPMPTASIRQFSCPSLSDLARVIDERAQGVDSSIPVKLVYSDFPKNTSH